MNVPGGSATTRGARNHGTRKRDRPGTDLAARSDDHFGQLLDRLYEANPSHLLSLLCVGGTLPIACTVEHGHASDQPVNHSVLVTPAQPP